MWLIDVFNTKKMTTIEGRISLSLHSGYLLVRVDSLLVLVFSWDLLTARKIQPYYQSYPLSPVLQQDIQVQYIPTSTFTLLQGAQPVILCFWNNNSQDRPEVLLKRSLILQGCLNPSVTPCPSLDAPLLVGTPPLLMVAWRSLDHGLETSLTARSPFCTSSPVTSASVGGGGAGWEALLCSHVDVCCLRGWQQHRAWRGTQCRRRVCRLACLRASLGGGIFRNFSPEKRGWMVKKCDEYRRETLGHMVIKRSCFGSRCAQRLAVSFLSDGRPVRMLELVWKHPRRVVFSLDSPSPFCLQTNFFLSPIWLSFYAPFQLMEKKNGVLRVVVGSQQTWITKGVATRHHPDTTTSVTFPR